MDYEKILDSKIAYYGKTEAAFQFAAEEYATRKMIDENLSLLKMAKLHMDQRACIVIQSRIAELENMLRPV